MHGNKHMLGKEMFVWCTVILPLVCHVDLTFALVLQQLVFECLWYFSIKRMKQTNDSMEKLAMVFSAIKSIFKLLLWYAAYLYSGWPESVLHRVCADFTKDGAVEDFPQSFTISFRLRSRPRWQFADWCCLGGDSSWDRLHAELDRSRSQGNCSLGENTVPCHSYSYYALTQDQQPPVF